jgi:hypothetical protein
VRTERALFALHGAALALALLAALGWPRVGEPALLLTPGDARLSRALAWASREQAEYLAIDTQAGRVIARIPSTQSLVRALGQGIVPVAARGAGCMATGTGGAKPWKS